MPKAQAVAFSCGSTALTDAGAHRAVNEDRLLAQPDCGFWAVADGMGGHAGGEAAAARLIASLELVQHDRPGFVRLSNVTRAVEDANAALFEQAKTQGVSGATLVSLMVHDGHYACLWAGDSRAYRFRDRRLERLTRDHSMVQELIDSGALAEQDRHGHPIANVITRAVGAAGAISLEQNFGPLRDRDRFLLCSDGLTVCVSDNDIAETLASGGHVSAAERLMEMALRRGAPDNVSIIVVDVHEG